MEYSCITYATVFLRPDVIRLRRSAAAALAAVN